MVNVKVRVDFIVNERQPICIRATPIYTKLATFLYYYIETAIIYGFITFQDWCQPWTTKIITWST